jgi:hypothetical protein
MTRNPLLQFDWRRKWSFGDCAHRAPGPSETRSSLGLNRSALTDLHQNSTLETGALQALIAVDAGIITVLVPFTIITTVQLSIAEA